MTSILLLIVASLVQEVALYTVAFFNALDKNLNFLFIFLIFVAATTLDIWLGFLLGQWFQNRFKHHKIGIFIAKKAKKLNQLLGLKSKGYILTALGIVNFPYLNAFIASWLDISFKRVSLYTLAGDSISFAIIWSVLLGISTLTLDLYIAIAISVAAISLLIFLIKRIIHL